MSAFSDSAFSVDAFSPDAFAFDGVAQPVVETARSGRGRIVLEAMLERQRRIRAADESDMLVIATALAPALAGGL